MKQPLTLLTLSSLALALALPASGHAAEYCVGVAGTGCDGGSYAFTAAGLNNAVSAATAAPGFDAVRLAAGSLSAPGPITLSGPDGIALVGAGAGVTTLNTTQSSGVGLQLQGAMNSVHDLSVKTTGLTTYGSVLNLSAAATAHHVAVIEASTAVNNSSVYGAQLSGDAKLTDSTIQMNSVNDAGATSTSNSASLTDVTITGSGSAAGITSSTAASDTLTLKRVRISGFTLGINTDGGAVSIADSLIDLGSTTGSTGVRAANFNNGQIPIVYSLLRSTIVGSGTAQRGVLSQADSPNEATSVTVDGSLVQLSGQSAASLKCVQASGGTASLSTINSAFGATELTGGCASPGTSKIDFTTMPLALVNPAAGDYRPTASSPLVDAGSTTAPLATTDLAGAARFADGDGDGTSALDIGAYEFQPLPKQQPPVVEQPGPTGPANPGTGGGSSTSGVPEGQRQPAAPTATALPSVAIATRPTLPFTGKGGFTLTTKAGKRTLRLTLTEASGVKLTLARAVAGHRTSAGAACVAGKGKPRCTVFTPLKGSATVTTTGLTATLGFGRKFGGKTLKAGTYRLTITPLRGAITGAPVSVSVKVG